MEGRNSFTFYRSFYEAANQLSKRSRLGLYEAILAYALDEVEPELTDKKQKAAFILIKPVLDTGRKKALAGQLGGSKPKAKRKQTESKGEIEKENEKEKELETENEDDSLYPAGFCEFWDLYPVKLGKDAALSAWNRLKPDPGAVCDGVKKWLQTNQWIKENGRFIPRAAKFIQERHYEYLPGDHIPMGASGVLGKAELEAIEMMMREK